MKYLPIIILTLVVNSFCFSQGTLLKINPIQVSGLSKISVRNGLSGERPFAMKIDAHALDKEFTFHMYLNFWTLPCMRVDINQDGFTIVGFHDEWNSNKQIKDKDFNLDIAAMDTLKSILTNYHYMKTDGNYHPVNCDTGYSIVVSDGWQISGYLNVQDKHIRDYEYGHYNLCESMNQKLSLFMLKILEENIKNRDIKKLIKKIEDVFNDQIKWCNNNMV